MISNSLTQSSGTTLGTSMKTIQHHHWKEQKCKRPSFAFQKAMNCTLKGRLLQRKRRPFATALIIRQLQRRQEYMEKRWPVTAAASGNGGETG